MSDERSLVLSPAAGYSLAVAGGIAKANHGVPRVLLLSVQAGCYIGFGGTLALTVGGACPSLDPGLQKLVFGAFGLPFTLTMIVLTGAELFTGNSFVVTAAWLEGKCTAAQCARSLLFSWLGNFLGCLFVMLLVVVGGTLAGSEYAMNIAIVKASAPVGPTIAKAILCNWLVCMAIFMAGMAKDVSGKVVAIWLPISAFVAMGFEHTVANMTLRRGCTSVFAAVQWERPSCCACASMCAAGAHCMYRRYLVTLGIALGAPVEVGDFLLRNLLPVTMGNVVGALLGLVLPFSAAYGRLGVGVFSAPSSGGMQRLEEANEL